MPELPEVETLCRQLRTRAAGLKIKFLTVYDAKINGVEVVRGRIIQDIRRSGKTILIDLDDATSLAVHLRMTGRLLWKDNKTISPHTRLRISFETAVIDLVDARRFATVKIVATPQAPPATDLTVHFDEQAFMERQAKRKVNIKVLLMDAKAFSGIGNIYACEILHRARISPTRQAATLSRDEWKKIFREARRILKKAIDKRGTSISDWRDLYNRPGENQHELAVYGREGKACPSCGGPIERMKQGGRGTFHCPLCQK